MLTKLHIKNFKQFEDVEIELGPSTVFIGPNNSGKTTALQALALWTLFINLIRDKIDANFILDKYGAVSLPFSIDKDIWRNLLTENSIEVTVYGIQNENEWELTAKLDSSGKEADIRLGESQKFNFDTYPKILYQQTVTPIRRSHPRLERSEIEFALTSTSDGSSRTLHSLCYIVYTETKHWKTLVDHLKYLFGITLLPPELTEIPQREREEITINYITPDNIVLNLVSSGRGMLQVLLLLSYMYVNPGAVLLLDEPDAHLEILRQRQIYQLLTETAHEQGAQIIAATHSEVILNEVADRDILIAFVGKPHRIDDRSQRSQVAKALKEIGFEAYYQAEQTGWVLYLEGSTDLAILREFARKLNHDPALQALSSPFVEYVANDVNAVRKHFWGVKEAKQDLVAYALFDRLERGLPKNFSGDSLKASTWQRREIENYLCMPQSLLAYAETISEENVESNREIMNELITDYVPPIAMRERDNQWWINTKASDDFLDLVFKEFFERLNLPNLMRKTDYHTLAKYVPEELIDDEVREKLDMIAEVFKSANPRT